MSVPGRTEKHGTCVSASSLEKAAPKIYLISGNCRPNSDPHLLLENKNKSLLLSLGMRASSCNGFWQPSFFEIYGKLPWNSVGSLDYRRRKS